MTPEERALRAEAAMENEAIITRDLTVERDRLIDVLRAIASGNLDARQMRNSAVAILTELGR